MEVRAIKGLVSNSKIAKEKTLHTSNRLEILREMNKVNKIYSDWALLSFADENEWPVLMVTCLPKLYFTKQKLYVSKNTVSIVWKEALNLVPSGLEYQIIKTYCKGELVEVSMSKKTYLFINEIAVMLEEARLKSPFPSYHSLIGVINQYANSFELSMKKESNILLYHQFQTKRENLLTDELKFHLEKRNA